MSIYFGEIIVGFNWDIKKKRNQKEKKLQVDITSYLNGISDCFAFIVDVNAVPITTPTGIRFKANPMAGCPDILCCYNGLFLAFEVKVKPNKPTPKQKAFINVINLANGKAFIVYSLFDVMSIMTEIINNK